MRGIEVMLWLNTEKCKNFKLSSTCFMGLGPVFMGHLDLHQQIIRDVSVIPLRLGGLIMVQFF